MTRATSLELSWEPPWIYSLLRKINFGVIYGKHQENSSCNWYIDRWW